MHLGLIAAARITAPAIIEPVRSGEVEGVHLTAVAARGIDRARAAAEDWGIERAYGSYQELIDDPDIGAVYIATPNVSHHELSLAALAAGKHVLCEKPIAVDAAQATELMAAAAATRLICMEAFHWRYHPLASQIGVIVASGELGRPLRATARFCLPEGWVAPDDIRRDFDLAGGALMDLGCYCIQWLRYVDNVSTGAGEPTVVAAEAMCIDDDVDVTMRAELRWESGLVGTLECSMVATERAVDLVVEGTAGTLRVINPVAPQFGALVEIVTEGGRRTVEVDGGTTTTYSHQLRAFLEAVRSGIAPVTSGADSIATAATIADCYRAAGLRPRPARP